MPKILIPVCIAAAAIVVAVAARPGAAERKGAVTCTGGLVAELKQGPDAGLMLRGTYSLRIAPSGNFTGTLTTASGGVPMAGQADGRAVNWIFSVPRVGHLYVAGTSLHPLAACTKARPAHFWGVATGPRFGDLGVWADTKKGGKIQG